MSEEILRALTQLFAIITKQDGGVTKNERDFVINFFKQELDRDSVEEYVELYDQSVEFDEYKEPGSKEKPVRKLTSVKDSVKTLSICKKINKTLTQKQKIVVLAKILEVISSDEKITDQRMEIIDTVSTVFNIEKDEFRSIEAFVLKKSSKEMPFQDILVVSHQNTLPKEVKHITTDIEGEAVFLRVNSVDLYFVRYLGKEGMLLNGFQMKGGRVYLFSHGSTIKLSFNARDVNFQFPDGTHGLRNINISEGPGKLIGIMGASGSGKTTLLRTLSGIISPTSGKVLLNGINIHTESKKIRGAIGYVSQDDMLMEDLTVYQNLYYNAKLCFRDLNEEKIHQKVMDVLNSLGLEQRKDLKVGSVLSQTISGGQRKRLNIALELIREPAVLFVDEPTSGLSSRDSENVIDLLKELSLRGKLIFVIIHQPSSDIYKMFDKSFLMDMGGFTVYYGNPVEAISYLKQVTSHVDSQRGQCPECGNVNPEQIFNIIEARVVNEYGEFTSMRKIKPEQWDELYQKHFSLEQIPDETSPPPSTLKIPPRWKQTLIFTSRDFLSKIANRQYLLINLLEAPLLALILALIIRYKNSPDGTEYLFRYNDNFPVYLMICIIVALFMGLTVSAEEIFRERKILARESFLRLSWSSFLASKLILLFFLSAIQTFVFILIGNGILEVKGMTFSFWLVLFTISCMSNVMGLNISSAFDSAVTVYILIPLLIIPQLILSGTLFPFEKLNELISTKGKTPIIADLMASRWSYEAMAVYQFKENDFQKNVFSYEMKERSSFFYVVYLLPQLRKKLHKLPENMYPEDPNEIEGIENDLSILRNEISELQDYITPEKEKLTAELTRENFSDSVRSQGLAFIDKSEDYFQKIFKNSSNQKEAVLHSLDDTVNSPTGMDLNGLKNTYYNESLADLVRNINTRSRLIEYDGKFLQEIDPIYFKPRHIGGPLDYRAHFFAPQKHFLGKFYDTYSFNILAMWLTTILLYIALYFKLLRKIVVGISNMPSLIK